MQKRPIPPPESQISKRLLGGAVNDQLHIDVAFGGVGVRADLVGVVGKRFSVSLGCIDANGDVLVGVVYDPNFDECFRAVRGQGVTCNGERISVSSAPRLRDSLAASGFPGDLRATDNNTVEWAAFVSRCQGMCRMGSAALDLCYVASGRFDLYWEHGLAPWDMCAGVLIVREAGGKVTDYLGQTFYVHKRGGLLASNGKIHDEAVSVMESVRKERANQ